MVENAERGWNGNEMMNGKVESQACLRWILLGMRSLIEEEQEEQEEQEEEE